MSFRKSILKALNAANPGVSDKRFSQAKAELKHVMDTIDPDPTEDKLYIFDWTRGGYNTVIAKNIKEAIKLAIAKGTPTHGAMTDTLTPVNVRIAKPGEVDSYERRFN